MKIRMTFEFSTTERQAIAEHIGHTLATRAEVKDWVKSTIRSTLEVVSAEYEKAHSCENCGCWEHLPGPCDTCDCEAAHKEEA